MTKEINLFDWLRLKMRRPRPEPPLPVDKMLFVLAGTYDQYDAWLKKAEIDSKIMVKYLHRPEQLRGMDPAKCKVVFVGQYWLNTVYDTIDLHEFVLKIRKVQDESA